MTYLYSNIDQLKDSSAMPGEKKNKGGKVCCIHGQKSIPIALPIAFVNGKR